MLRATCALLAVLIPGVAACTFNRSGSLPGPAPMPDGHEEPDATPMDALTSDSDSPSSNDGEEMEPDSRADAPADGPLVETDASDGAIDAGTETDAVPPNDADASLMDDAPPSDGPFEAASDAPVTDADGGFDCARIPNGATFLPPGETRAHCYWLEMSPVNWLTATNACAVLGGHLVTISSSAETSFVLGIITPFSTSDRIWIGATDSRFSGDGPGSGPYVWITGEAMTYTNWSNSPVQEPNGACDPCGGGPCNCEHRAAMVNNGRWVDLYEALQYRFVCEAEL